MAKKHNIEKEEFINSLLSAHEEEFKDIATDDVEKIFTTSEVDIGDFFYSACKNGKLDVVKYILTLPEEEYHQFSNFDMEEAFKMACEHGHSKIAYYVVKYLLTSRDSIEDYDIQLDSNESYRLACKSGHLDVVRYLLTSPELSKHADIHFYNSFELACENGHLDVVKYLLTSPELKEHANIYNTLGFRQACKNGHLDVVEFMIASPELQHNYTFENFKPIEYWFNEYGAEQMHDWISHMPQERIDSLYEKHEDLFIEKFTLEANLPIHQHNFKEIQQQEEIEILI